MPEWLITLIVAAIGGSAAAAIVNAFHDRWKFNAQRKADIEDRETEKLDKTDELRSALAEFIETDGKKNDEINQKIENMEISINAQSEALKLLLLDKILETGNKYIQKGEITFEERKRFHEMHKCYHQGLNGNGDADLVVDGVDELKLSP